ncbi:hypothetical protein CRG98_012217 [Punica granatum]|uniref:Uncharacterized protein n=1 Tax=Punica granatum TaxID=22663 RepID=A0A2I0KFV4_PUNGR|nr:hypothetical protein CRG98_012217 [Punica granatum]
MQRLRRHARQQALPQAPRYLEAASAELLLARDTPGRRKQRQLAPAQLQIRRPLQLELLFLTALVGPAKGNSAPGPTSLQLLRRVRRRLDLPASRSISPALRTPHTELFKSSGRGFKRRRVSFNEVQGGVSQN